MNNTITIENLKVFAYHGVYPEETATGQDFYLTLKLYFDTSYFSRHAYAFWRRRDAQNARRKQQRLLSGQ